MPSPDRAEILRRAREAVLEHGRSFVVVLGDRDELRDGLLPELEERLGEERDAETLIDSEGIAVESLRPERETVGDDALTRENGPLSVVQNPGSSTPPVVATRLMMSARWAITPGPGQPGWPRWNIEW